MLSFYAPLAVLEFKNISFVFIEIIDVLFLTSHSHSLPD